MNIETTFYKYKDEFLKFDHIENKMSNWRDIHAFLLLNRLFPEVPPRHVHDIVSAAEHDQIWLNVDIDEFEKVATKGIVCELCRCGVFYDDETESLSMFV